MNEGHWKQVKGLLNEVLTLDASARSRFLESSGASAEVRSEVESLIAFEEASADMMQLSAVEFSREFTEDAGDLSGEVIGPYRLIREIGYGGMGAVYLAERIDGNFSQRVALKLLKREMNTSALRRRFQQEQEILASLEHPNIARLLDAGTSTDRVPFIAMEYVDGLPIDEYCETNALGVNERLELFCTVCAAVEFAHRNLVIHRDLKPSNVLVTHDGIPKLLDFGISKIVSKEYGASDAATITRLGVMTPAYASPEQLRRDGVTTLSDVFSLGVILFELLSGHRPFEKKEHDLHAIFDAVINSQPVPPSSLVGTAPALAQIREHKLDAVTEDLTTRREEARRTGSGAATLSSSEIKGDLDNIVLKAISKEPERRYASVGNLAEDIRRHLSGLTVSARPNTLGYRANKFIARNRVFVSAGLIVVIAVFAGIMATLWQTRVASAERERAEKRFNDVRKLANSNLFEVYPEVENLEGSLKARELILKNAQQYLDSLYGEAASDPELQAELATAYEKIGDVLGAMNNSSLGNIRAGLDSYEKARNLRESVLAADPRNVEAKEKLANNQYVIARTLWNNSQTNEASAAFEQVIELRRSLVSENPDTSSAKNRLAVALIDYGAIPLFNFQSEKALALYGEAHQIINELRAADPRNTTLKKSLTRLIRSQSKAKAAVGQVDEALRDLAVAVDVSRELAAEFPEDFPVQRSVWLTNTIICEVMIDSAVTDEVVEACSKTTAFPEAALQKEPENGVVGFDLAISHFNLARAYRLADQPENTISSARNALRVMSDLSAKNPSDLEYKRNLAIYSTEIARAQIKLARHGDALVILRKVIDELDPIIAADQGSTTIQYDLGVAHRLAAQASFRTGDRPAAQSHIDEAIAICSRLNEMKSLRASDADLLAQLSNERSEYLR